MSRSSVSAHSDLPSLPAYIVVAEVRGDRFTRRPYLSLASAERAVDRARAQGRFACIRLMRCVPSEEVL